jgi:DnaK suppressor protein
VDKSEREKLAMVINDRIDELTLMLHPDETRRAGDDDDAALDGLISSAVDSAVDSSAHLKLNLLKRNLDWIASEDAGYCDNCGCEINFERLLAIPTTRVCIDCALKAEQIK